MVSGLRFMLWLSSLPGFFGLLPASYCLSSGSAQLSCVPKLRACYYLSWCGSFWIRSPKKNPRNPEGSQLKPGTSFSWAKGAILQLAAPSQLLRELLEISMSGLIVFMKKATCQRVRFAKNSRRWKEQHHEQRIMAVSWKMAAA